jgi:hypothetical protein
VVEMDLTLFVEVKRLFSTTLEVKKRRRKKVTGVIGHGLGMTRRVRSMAAEVWHGTLGLHTSASDRSRDRRVRSSPREAAKHARSIERGVASGHDRSDASGREWVLTEIDRMLTLWHPVSTSGASGQASQQREHLATRR